VDRKAAVKKTKLATVDFWKGMVGMKTVLIISGLIGLGLLAYLFYVLFRGESL